MISVSQFNRLARRVGAAPIKRPQPQPRGMNGTEQAYLAHLALRLKLGLIAAHSGHEPLTIPLANGVRYKPDFWYERLNGERVYVEVKGTKDSEPYYRTERGRLKPIWAAQRGWAMVLAWRVAGTWRERKVVA